MKIIKTSIMLFFLIFLIGLLLNLSNSIQTVGTTATALTKISKTYSTPQIQIKSTPEIDEDDEWKDNYDAKFSIKLLETGEFHGDEIRAQSNQTWLGLFKKGNKFFLAPTKIKVKTVFDVIADNEEKVEKTGRSVSVSGKNQPVFLLKNVSLLKQRKITTVFYEEGEGSLEATNINNSTEKILKLNDVSYNLNVSTKKEKSGLLDETSKLILSNGKIEQIIYSQKKCDDCGWGIYWAGDLDNDGKLDLYFNLTNHYNVNHRRLFLSSQAEPGKLVKEVANFRTVGC